MNAKAGLLAAVLFVASSGGAYSAANATTLDFETTPQALPSVQVANQQRLDGADRYETAVKISRTIFPVSAGTAVLVSGENYPDGLVAGATAARLGAPLLLTAHSSLPPSTAAELKRLNPKQILLVGGSGAIDMGMENRLETILPGAKLLRVSGEDRYQTAAAVSQHFWGSETDSVMLVSGNDFPDALVAGPAAARLGAPLLLSNPARFDPTTVTELKRLKPQTVYVIGKKLPSDASAQLRESLPGVSLVPVGGTDRFDTAFNVSQQFWGQGFSGALVTSAQNFPDALSGAVLSKAAGLPVLLSGPTCNSQPIVKRLSTVGNKVFLGGTGAVSNEATGKVCPPPVRPTDIVPGQNHIYAAQSYVYPAGQVQDWLLRRQASPTYPQQKVVFLTFDDGPSANTAQNLQTLASRGVHATFFVATNQLGSAATQQILRQELLNGHAVAVHTASHNYQYLYPRRVCSPANVGADYARAVDTVRSILGPQWGTGAFRYPGGQMSWRGMAPCNQLMASRAMTWIDWNVEIGDALSRSLNAKQLLNRMRSQVPRTGNVAVVLMHDSAPKTATVAALPSIIDYFVAQGYSFGVIG